MSSKIDFLLKEDFLGSIEFISSNTGSCYDKITDGTNVANSAFRIISPSGVTVNNIELNNPVFVHKLCVRQVRAQRNTASGQRLLIDRFRIILKLFRGGQVVKFPGVQSSDQILLNQVVDRIELDNAAWMVNPDIIGNLDLESTAQPWSFYISLTAVTIPNTYDQKSYLKLAEK